MSREYYAYGYCLDEKDSFLIWFSNEKDGFVVDENGFIPSFKTIKELKDYAIEKKLVIDSENLKFLNLDIVENWIKSDAKEIENYSLFLDTWNLFDDISSSTDGTFDVDRTFTYNIYDRIFWGCNIPAMTPLQESFTPTWTKKELKIIRKTLNSGFQMFRGKIIS